MSSYADWFVGGVTIAIGASALWGALSANQHIFTMPKVRLLEASVGRSGARGILGALGMALIALGIAIALGWKWPWFSEQPATIVTIVTRSVSEEEARQRSILAHASGSDARSE
jgi:hypothetical protein